MIFTLILIIHVLVCLVLIVSVLLQRGKGATMGAAFGTGGSQTVFGGSGAGNFLSRVTTICAAIFFSTSLILAYRSTFNRSVVDSADLKTAPAPKAAPAPEPSSGATPAAAPGANAPSPKPIEITIPPRPAAPAAPAQAAPTPAPQAPNPAPSATPSPAGPAAPSK